MAVFEVEKDGKIYEVDAPDINTAIAALTGGNGDMPEGMVLNPATGQVEDLRSAAHPKFKDNRATAANVGGAQGLGLGSLDEVTGAIHGAMNPSTFGESYAYGRDVAREQERRSREQFPGTVAATEIAGGLTTGVALGAPVAGARLTAGGQALTGGLTGAGEGLLYGFLSGEGGAKERAQSAGAYGLLGGAVGTAAPYAIEGGKRAIRAVTNPGRTALDIGSTTASARAIQTAIQRSGKSADEIQGLLDDAARSGQPEFALMDALGNPGQRMASGIARTPGDARTEIVDYLASRQDGQAERISSQVSDALFPNSAPGTDIAIPGQPMIRTRDAALRSASSAEEAVSGLKGARSDAANRAYDAAREGASPVDVRGALAAIDERIGPMQGSGVKGDGIDARLSRYKARLAAPESALKDGETARELSDFDRVLGVKQDVSDDIGAAVRGGRNNEARLLGKLNAQLDAALEAASPGYRQANDSFRTASREIDAVGKGAKASETRRRANDVLREFGNLNPQEKVGFKLGYGNDLLKRIESQSTGANKARQLMTPKRQAELAELGGDRLQGQIGRENTMFETDVIARGGSKTADNMEDISDVGAFDMGLLTNIFTGRWGAAGAQLAQTAGNAMSGQGEKTRAMIGKALMSRDVAAAIKPALDAAKTSAERQKVIQAFVRGASLRLAPMSEMN